MRGAAILCAVALLAAGCAGYHLGPANGATAGARSIQIEPFANRTLEPRLGEYVINSLRKNLQQDGTYRLDTHEDGDIIVSGEIVSYDRSGVTFAPNDATTVVDYQITLTARIKARERATGRVIFDKPVTGRTTLRAGSDLTSAEREAMPMLADDLARRATSLLTDGTW